MKPETDDLSFEDLPEDTNPPFSRRKMLRRLTGVAIAGSTLSGLIGCAFVATTPLATLYPGLAGKFGSLLDLGSRKQFPAAMPEACTLNKAGVFYRPSAKTFLVHLDKDTPYLLTGSALARQLDLEEFGRDQDGSYWLALSHRCVHLGTTLAFFNECRNFKCPSHGAHYHCDGEYLDGPALRSMDRFPLVFQGENILVDTGTLLKASRPDNAIRLLPVPTFACLPDLRETSRF